MESLERFTYVDSVPAFLGAIQERLFTAVYAVDVDDGLDLVRWSHTKHLSELERPSCASAAIL